MKALTVVILFLVSTSTLWGMAGSYDSFPSAPPQETMEPSTGTTSQSTGPQMSQSGRENLEDEKAPLLSPSNASYGSDDSKAEHPNNEFTDVTQFVGEVLQDAQQQFQTPPSGSQPVQNLRRRVPNRWLDETLAQLNTALASEAFRNNVSNRILIARHADRFTGNPRLQCALVCGECDSRWPARCISRTTAVACTLAIPAVLCALHTQGYCPNLPAGAIGTIALNGCLVHPHCPWCNPAQISQGTYNCLTCNTSLIEISEQAAVQH